MDGLNIPETIELFNRVAFERNLATQITLADIEVEYNEDIAKDSERLITNLGGVPDPKLHRVAQRAMRFGYMAMGLDIERDHNQIASAFEQANSNPDWGELAQRARQQVAATPHLNILFQSVTPDLCVTASPSEKSVAYTVAALVILQAQQVEQQAIAQIEEDEQRAAAMRAASKELGTKGTFDDILLANGINPFGTQANNEPAKQSTRPTLHIPEVQSSAEPTTKAEYVSFDKEVQAVLDKVAAKIDAGHIPETTIEMLHKSDVQLPELSMILVCEQAQALAYALVGANLYEDGPVVEAYYKRNPVPKESWEVYVSECVYDVTTRDALISEQLDTYLAFLKTKSEDEKNHAHAMACVALSQIWALQAEEASVAKHRKPESNHTQDDPPEDQHWLPFQD
ncbi:hypothetical protein EYC59_06545 [Candidatus Saccharibacteria bacterium]|nr:MAG: hypothetical protein EYC59_06545 [Candidatus Saccharibacteria bacterium]